MQPYGDPAAPYGVQPSYPPTHPGTYPQQHSGAYHHGSSTYPPQPPHGTYPPPAQPHTAGYPPPQPHSTGYPPQPNAYYPGSGTYPPQPSAAYPPPPAEPHVGYRQYAPPTDTLRQWFDRVDTDRSGRIDVHELSTALSTGGYKFNATVAEKLIRMFSAPGQLTPSLTFDEFHQLNGFLSNMSQGFRQRDTDNSGTLDVHEVRSALNASGFHISEPVFHELMRKVDRQRRGSLAFDAYIEASILLSTVRNTFTYYDFHRNGNITMTLDQFIGATLQLV